jgi:hypothetical protein
MPLFGQKTWFRARMNEIKSVIPYSGNQTLKSPIKRCACGHETPFEVKIDKSGFGDFGDCWQHIAFQRLAIFYKYKSIINQPTERNTSP